MTSTIDELRQVAVFSEQYREEHIEASPGKTDSKKDPFRVNLLFRKIFASARSDTVSKRYREATETVLRERESEIRARWVSDEDSLSERTILDELDNAGVGNQHDRQMVVETIDYLGELEDFDHSIIDYAQSSIEQGKIDNVYDELTSIHNTGPKKTTLFLRDVVSGSNLEEYVNGDEYRYVFPVDTRVFQVAEELDLVSTESPQWETNSAEIVEACGDSVSPIQFNQGAWYIGANAFEIVIEQLDKLNPERN